MVVAGMLWLAAVIAGSLAMLRYANTPGHAAQAPLQWSANSLIARDSQRATLVMFVHPRCPCSRASVGELSLLMAHCQGRVNAHVLFFKPAGSAAEWAETDLWRSAAAIPGVEVHSDDGGVEARRFHAETSGHTVLYDRARRLQFSGGITAARGHSGDNAGRSAIAALVNGGAPQERGTPVYGCSLVNPESKCQAGVSLCTH